MDKPTDVSGLVKLVEEEIARRGLLPENHAADRSDDSIDSDVSYEWLLIECDVPDCNEFTEVDLIAADPVHDDPRSVLCSATAAGVRTPKAATCAPNTRPA